MDSKQLPPQGGYEAGYTTEEYLAIMEPVFQRRKAVIDQCVAGLTVYAAGLAAKGLEPEVFELGQFISGMAGFWDPDTAGRHTATYEQAVAAARNSGEAPVLTDQIKADIRAGLTLHAEEMRAADPELEYWADACDSFAEALEEQWQAEDTSFRQDTAHINMELGGI